MGRPIVSRSGFSRGSALAETMRRALPLLLLPLVLAGCGGGNSEGCGDDSGGTVNPFSFGGVRTGTLEETRYGGAPTTRPVSQAWIMEDGSFRISFDFGLRDGGEGSSLDDHRFIGSLN